MAKQNSGLGSIGIVVSIIFMLFKIGGKIQARALGLASNNSWEKDHLSWYIFFLVFLIGALIYRQSKISRDDENELE